MIEVNPTNGGRERERERRTRCHREWWPSREFFFGKAWLWLRAMRSEKERKEKKELPTVWLSRYAALSLHFSMQLQPPSLSSRIFPRWQLGLVHYESPQLFLKKLFISDLFCFAHLFLFSFYFKMYLLNKWIYTY